MEKVFFSTKENKKQPAKEKIEKGRRSLVISVTKKDSKYRRLFYRPKKIKNDNQLKRK